MTIKVSVNFVCITGQVTYRVVQVTGDGTESAQVVATNAFQPGAQVTQKWRLLFNDNNARQT